MAALCKTSISCIVGTEDFTSSIGGYITTDFGISNQIMGQYDGAGSGGIHPQVFGGQDSGEHLTPVGGGELQSENDEVGSLNPTVPDGTLTPSPEPGYWWLSAFGTAIVFGCGKWNAREATF